MEFTKQSLKDIQVRPVERNEEALYQEQMARHHYLGSLVKIGETIRYVATWQEQWVAQLLVFGAQMRCSRSMDWMGLSLAVWTAELDREQQSLLQHLDQLCVV